MLHIDIYFYTCYFVMKGQQIRIIGANYRRIMIMMTVSLMKGKDYVRKRTKSIIK